MSKVYLAHNFVAREWLKETVKFLEREGHLVTSNWILEESRGTKEDAVMDLLDIERADTFILFTDQYGLTPGRGKYLELGYALRAAKRCILVGNDQTSCIFFHLPNIRHCKTLEEALPLI